MVLQKVFEYVIAIFCYLKTTGNWDTKVLKTSNNSGEEKNKIKTKGKNIKLSVDG